MSSQRKRNKKIWKTLKLLWRLAHFLILELRCLISLILRLKRGKRVRGGDLRIWILIVKTMKTVPRPNKDTRWSMITLILIKNKRKQFLLNKMGRARRIILTLHPTISFIINYMLKFNRYKRRSMISQQKKILNMNTLPRLMMKKIPKTT